MRRRREGGDMLTPQPHAGAAGGGLPRAADSLSVWTGSGPRTLRNGVPGCWLAHHSCSGSTSGFFGSVYPKRNRNGLQTALNTPALDEAGAKSPGEICVIRPSTPLFSSNRRAKRAGECVLARVGDQMRAAPRVRRPGAPRARRTEGCPHRGYPTRHTRWRRR